MSPTRAHRSPRFRPGVAAKQVIRRVFDDAGAHGVQIDVRREGLKDFRVVVEDHAGESLHPQGAFAAGVVVVPEAHGLFVFFHELGDVPHAGEVFLAQIGVDAAPVLYTLARQDDLRVFVTVKMFQPVEQLLVGDAGLGGGREPGEDVKVVVHHAKGDHFKPAEAGGDAHDLDHLLLAALVEEVVQAGGARDQMIHHRGLRRFVPWHSHTKRGMKWLNSQSVADHTNRGQFTVISSGCPHKSTVIESHCH